MIKLKDLLFEQTKTEQLPAVTFGDNFQNNYITVTGDWQSNANLVIKQIQDELAKGKTLEDLTIKVYGGASNLPATNGYMGSKPPNHNFQTVGVTTGGLLPGGKWVKISAPGKETPGYKNLKDWKAGNNWLANARAEALKAKLVPYISRALKRKFENIEVTADPVTAGSTKSARAVVTSAVKPTIPKPTYVIQYKWYTVGNDKNMVLVDTPLRKSAAGFRNNTNGSMDTSWYKEAMSDKNIIYSGFQKAGGVKPYAFIKLNAKRYSKTFAIYDDEASWLADVKKMAKYASEDQTAEELSLTTPGEKPGQILPGYQGTDGYLNRSGKSQYYGYAEFHMDAPSHINNKKPYYLFKPQGDTSKYVVDLFPARSFKAPSTGAKNSKGEKSMLIGKRYDVDINGTNAIVYTGQTTIKPYS